MMIRCREPLHRAD